MLLSWPFWSWLSKLSMQKRVRMKRQAAKWKNGASGSMLFHDFLLAMISQNCNPGAANGSQGLQLFRPWEELIHMDPKIWYISMMLIKFRFLMILLKKTSRNCFILGQWWPPGFVTFTSRRMCVLEAHDSLFGLGVWWLHRHIPYSEYVFTSQKTYRYKY